MVQFFEMLKNERVRLGLTQDEVAKACGISKRAYNYYENGERAANSDFLMAFAELGADIGYLFSGVHSENKLSSLENMALLAFNRLTKDGQKSNVITYMAMLESGLINGDMHSLWETRNNSTAATQPKSDNGININNSKVGNFAGRDLTVKGK